MKDIKEVYRSKDGGRWEIYADNRLVGYFELEGRPGCRSYEFKSCTGPTIGGNGKLSGNQPAEFYLRHFAKSLKMHYWRHKREKGIKLLS